MRGSEGGVGERGVEALQEELPMVCVWEGNALRT